MYVAWVQIVIGILIFVAGVAAIAISSRKIAGYKAAGHGGGAWSSLRVLGIAVALLAIFLMVRATAFGGAHEPLDEETVDDLGQTYFDEHYYVHGQINKDGFDEWQRYVNPDYDNATSSVDNNSSGTYCIKVTRQYGGQYGEDGHSTGYQPTDIEKKKICIPVVWNGDLEDFEAVESDEE
jgi:uncharacterized membrane protein